MRSEIARTEKALFFGGDEDEEKRAAEFFGMSFEVRGDVEKNGAARSIVHTTVVDAIAVHGLTDADVVEMRGEDDEFVFENGF